MVGWSKPAPLDLALMLAIAASRSARANCCKRRFRPIAAGMEEQLAIRCDKALQAFGAKLCQRLVQ
ncbi:hypothetical protein, partial [Methylosinus sp. RM1]|uniref:hypothetical protein n=1 Tax=Methylosinus sp. RM1 TaxID=2583817 RepID=UPI001A9C2E52